MKEHCPGSREIRQPWPEEIRCRKCGAALEIWSDETETLCKECGALHARPLGPSCAEWCASARECLGADVVDKIKKSAKR